MTGYDLLQNIDEFYNSDKVNLPDPAWQKT